METGKKKLFFIIPVALLVFSFGVWFLGSANPETPAGYVGYLTQGAVFGQKQFIGLQKGPTSPGRTWMYEVTNVSITPYTYTEEFSGDNVVLSKDQLNISFKVHLVWEVDETKIQDFVENYTVLGLGNDPEQVVMAAYKNNLQEPFRTMSRDAVQRLEGLKIKDNIVEVSRELTGKMQTLAKDTPFRVKSVVVGNIQYPREVSDAVSKKLAATQDLERKNIEIEIERREKEKRIVQAEGISKSMDIIKGELTPLYIQHEAIEAQKVMAGSPNHTVIYIPVGPNGVPVVGNLDLSKGQPKQ